MGVVKSVPISTRHLTRCVPPVPVTNHLDVGDWAAFFSSSAASSHEDHAWEICIAQYGTRTMQTAGKGVKFASFHTHTHALAAPRTGRWERAGTTHLESWLFLSRSDLNRWRPTPELRGVLRLSYLPVISLCSCVFAVSAHAVRYRFHRYPIVASCSQSTLPDAAPLIHTSSVLQISSYPSSQPSSCCLTGQLFGR